MRILTHIFFERSCTTSNDVQGNKNEIRHALTDPNILQIIHALNHSENALLESPTGKKNTDLLMIYLTISLFFFKKKVLVNHLLYFVQH
jgi:hypothetical protein